MGPEQEHLVGGILCEILQDGMEYLLKEFIWMIEHKVFVWIQMSIINLSHQDKMA